MDEKILMEMLGKLTQAQLQTQQDIQAIKEQMSVPRQEVKIEEQNTNVEDIMKKIVSVKLFYCLKLPPGVKKEGEFRRGRCVKEGPEFLSKEECYAYGDSLFGRDNYSVGSIEKSMTKQTYEKDFLPKIVKKIETVIVEPKKTEKKDLSPKRKTKGTTKKK